MSGLDSRGVGGWWLVVGGWWLVVGGFARLGGWWLVVGGWFRRQPQVWPVGVRSGKKCPMPVSKLF